ncbi:MAG: hypothetical protein L6R19_10520 [Alphaproteobacteria bacterium]|nr:hypothetical protein [Alphaproteobacteria bacterium]
MEGIALSSPTAGRFAGCLGQAFKLHAAGATLDLVLFEVEQLGQKGDVDDAVLALSAALPRDGRRARYSAARSRGSVR